MLAHNLPMLCDMPKARVVPIQKETKKAKLIAKDEKARRVIIGIGSRRIAFDVHTRITHLPPETGDQPAEVLRIDEKH